MNFELLLSIFISLGVVLSLTRKYLQAGLIVGGVGLILQAVFSYATKNDLLMCVLSALAAAGLFYELFKSIRIKDYGFDKRARLTTSIIFIVLGGLYLIVIGIPSYLLAGIIATIFICLESKKTEPRGSV